MGSVIMVIATTSLLSALEVIEMAFSDASRQPLSKIEERLLERADLKDPGDQVQFWQDSLKTLPRQVLSPESK